MIRLPDIPNVIPANPSPGAPSSAAMQARSRGIEDISRGLATVGTSLTSEALRIQQIENARRESEIRQGWQQSLAELNTRLATETDPTRIPQLTEDLIANLAPSLEDDSLPPALRDRLSEQFLNFSTGATIRAGEQASRLAITRARAAFENETTHAIRNHDRPGLEAAIATATDGFGLLPEHGEKIRDNADTEWQLRLLEDDAVTDPDLILSHDLDGLRRGYPLLENNHLRRAQANARQQIQIQRAEQIDSLHEALSNDRLTEEAITEADRLTAKDRQAFLKLMRGEQELDYELEPEAWGLIKKLEDAYEDPTIPTDKFFELWNATQVEIMRTVPEHNQGIFRQALSRQSPAYRNKREEDGTTSRTRSEARNHASLARSIITDALRDEYINRQQSNTLQVDMERWIQRNPTATWEQLEAWTIDSVRKSTGNNPEFSIRPAPPAPPGIPPAAVQRALDSMNAHPENPLLNTIDD